MANNINETISQWANVAVDRLHEALDEYEIGRLDGALWRSMAAELVRNGGNIDKVIIKFNQYGRFLDMGVGRGVPIGKRGTENFNRARRADGKLHRYKRKAKPWYSVTKTREVAILRDVLAREYGKQIGLAIENSLNTTITINR